MMCLPHDYLQRPWPDVVATAGGEALRHGRQQLQVLGFPMSFRDRLHVYLRPHVRKPLGQVGEA